MLENNRDARIIGKFQEEVGGDSLQNLLNTVVT